MKDAQILYDRGIGHQRKGEWDEAAICFQQAIRRRDRWPEALCNLGLALKKRNRLADAVRCFQKAADIQPQNPQIHNNLGNAFRTMGELDKAISAYGVALKLAPRYTLAIYNLSKAYGDQGKWSHAIAACQRAFEIDPHFFEACHDLGMLHKRSGDLDKAREYLQRAIDLNPESTVARLNLGNVLKDLNLWDDAIACLRALISQKPDSCEALYNLGNIYKQVSDFERAERYLKAAIDCRPDFTDAHFNLAQVLLAQGDMIHGWKEYEWRLKKDHAYAFHRPLWRGEDLTGKTILVQDEQGIGDTIQFIRYLPALAKTQPGGRIHLQTRKKLFRLIGTFPFFRENRIELLDKDEAIKDHDFTIPLMSLPGMFSTTCSSMVSQAPYLFAEPAIEKKWQRRIGHSQGFTIGICWQGSREYGGDKTRSIPLTYFYQLARIPDVQLISLQKFDGVDQLEKVPNDIDIINWESELDRGEDAFIDTAAIMKNLDLVITVDSALIHLAGAMGIPTWVLLAKVPDWRWGLNTDHSFWYPTVRIFRQTHQGRWEGVIAEVEKTLLHLMVKARGAILRRSTR